MAYSSIVIKAKFGETLRRFHAIILDGELVLDIPTLRDKICSLFGFDPDHADFTLTYIDEDGDAVNLVDEDDLHDIMSQFLNPLRIIVSLKKPHDQFQLQSGASETLKPAPKFQLPMQRSLRLREPRPRQARPKRSGDQKNAQVVASSGRTNIGSDKDNEIGVDQKKKDFRVEVKRFLASLKKKEMSWESMISVQWRSGRWQEQILTAINECPFEGVPLVVQDKIG